MNEINEIDKLVLVDVPKVIENEQIYVYIPIAVGDKPGLIAIPANSNDFVVENGYLKLKWNINEKLKNYVPRRSQPNIVYTTDSGGNDSAITFSSGALSGVIAKRTDNGDLIVLDVPVDEHGAVNKKYVDTRDNELDAAINTKLNKSSTPGIVYANTNDGELSEPTQIPYSSASDVNGESIVSRTYDGYFDVKDPMQDAHAANKKYADRIFNDGGTIKKDLNVLGDLKVQGNLVYVTGTIEGIEKQFVELNTNKKLVIGQSGLLINKGITEAGDLGTYAIVYDAGKDAVVCGLGTTRVDKIDGKDVLVFEFKKGEGLPLTIRDESDKIANGHLLKWDADGNKLIDTGKTVSDFVPKVIDYSRYRIYCQRPLNAADDPGGIQMIEYSSSQLYNTLVYRGYDGVVRGETAPLAQQNNLDLINRGELVSKLNNYEKSPHYVLIEKVITGYTVLETEPEDFTTNYASYYKTNGKARNDIDFNYVALTEAETFERGKYYSKTTGTTNLYRFGESGKELDGTPYAFKNIFINFENSNTTLGVWDPIHFYVGNRQTDAIYYGGLGLGVQTNKSQVNADMQGNAVNIYAMALSAENNATKLQFRKREIISETNPVLDGIKIHSLFPDTIVLIYGARI